MERLGGQHPEHALDGLGAQHAVVPAGQAGRLLRLRVERQPHAQSPPPIAELGDCHRPKAIEAQSLAERDVPEYVVPDGTAKVTFNRVPTLDEVPYPVRMEPNLVVEFYSR